jgi:hypothetical protein
LIDQEKLDFWIKKGKNVLFIGKHGVGKTQCVIEAFKRNNLNYQYFSASTMDPYIDFCGVPMKTELKNGEPVLELVLPKHIDRENIEAIFLDEYNRAPKKIRNATMELIQFKAINGKEFPKLKFIWAAINPEDDEALNYDVEPLDPAQKDRFHIHVDVPYKCDPEYFEKVYGPEIADASISWWNSLEDVNKDLVSPRRLDYAINYFLDGGELKDVLRKETNFSKLATELNLLDYLRKFIKIKETNNKKEAEKEANSFKDNKNLFRKIIQYPEEFGKFFIQHMNEEILVNFYQSDKNAVRNIMIDMIKKENTSDQSSNYDFYNKLSKIKGIATDPDFPIAIIKHSNQYGKDNTSTEVKYVNDPKLFSNFNKVKKNEELKVLSRTEELKEVFEDLYDCK